MTRVRDMSDDQAACVPPPRARLPGTFHWLEGEICLMVAEWSGDFWWVGGRDMDRSPEEMARRGWRYLDEAERHPRR